MKKILHLIGRAGPSRRPSRRPRAMAAPSQEVLQAPAGIRYIPGEEVLLLAVTLPKMSAAQRSAAAAFAVEDHIARPLDEVHVALGPELDANRWLVGVTARAALPVATKPGERILPDTLALPIPGPGHWAVLETKGRILIRQPDGTGFVTGAEALPVLHQIAQAPTIRLYAGDIALPHSRAPLPPPQLPARFDLTDRSGTSLAIPPLARRLMTIAAVAAAGHLAILAVDILSLSRKQADLARQLQSAAGAPPEARIDDLLAQVLAPKVGAPEAGFLPLLSATFAAVAAQTGQVSLRDLRYGAAQDSLTLTLQAADLHKLQQIETDLVSAQFAVTTGPATSASGVAEQQLTVQGPPP